MRLCLSIACAATLAFSTLAATDLTLTFARKGAGTAGTEIQYHTAKFHLNRQPEQKLDSLVDYEKGISYTINHKKKTIEMLKMEDALAALASLNQSQSQPEGLGLLMGSMFGDPNKYKVEKLGQETVAGRPCQNYLITVGKLTMALSADPTLKMPVSDAAYTRMMQAQAASFAKGGGPVGASFKRLYEEMAKIKGVPLKTEMKGFMGMNVSSVATKVEQGPIPADLFVLPVGYKMEDVGKKLREDMKGK